MSKYYAVKKGRKIGLFNSWEECKEQTKGFSGAIFKSFKTKQEAMDYLSHDVVLRCDNTGLKKQESYDSDIKNAKKADTIYHEDEKEVFLNIEEDEMIAYIDGSYEDSKKCFAYAGIMFYNNGSEDFAYADNDEELISMRNVSGEIKASMYVIQKAVDYGFSKITIYYDYSGIENWARGNWKSNNKFTKSYSDFCSKMSKKIKINFVKVKSHSNIKFNEYVDKLAKKAIEETSFK